VAALDRYIVGQNDAKRAVAVALRNRWRRQQLDDDLRDEVNPKPRLQMIDAWARTAVPGADSDLLGMALVDPDESVRTRAQELFERRIQLH